MIMIILLYLPTIRQFKYFKVEDKINIASDKYLLKK